EVDGRAREAAEGRWRRRCRETNPGCGSRNATGRPGDAAGPGGHIKTRPALPPCACVAANDRTSPMRRWLKRSAFVLVVLLVALGWLLYFHNAAVAARLPKWGWLQRTIARVGQSTGGEAPEDEDPDTTKT